MISSKELVNKIIDKLKLQPLLEEGGMYRQNYISDERYGDAPVGTSIYYLLTEKSFSHLHILPSDEVYHFYLGDPVELVELLQNGDARTTILGPDIFNNQIVQHVVKKYTWQGSRLCKGGKFALLGTTMSPGYLHSEYIPANADELKAKYPQYRDEIDSLVGKLEYK